MAIKIDIPGVGEVSVDGAAQESTMLAILEAVKQSDKTRQKEEKKVDTKAADEANKKLNETASELDNVISGLDDFDGSVGSSTRTVSQFDKNLLAAGKSTLNASKQIINFGASMAATAASASVSMIKSMDAVAENPINAGAAILDVTIDAGKEIAKAGIGVTASIVTGLITVVETIAAGLLGPLAPIAIGLGEGLKVAVGGISEAAKAAAEVTAKAAHVANEFMSKEYEKSANNAKTFNKLGASFAGGMGEMDKIATDAGMGIGTFSKILSNSRDEITQMGLGAAAASEKLSKGLSSLSTTTGKSGKFMRDELLNLGFSYEEQGEVMGQYMAQQRSFGKDLSSIVPADLAKGTAEYAKNLKVLSDATGQDAQKLLQAAQAESQRGMLEGKLGVVQKEGFTQAHAMLSAYGSEAQEALTQYIATGVIVNKSVAMNTDMAAMIRNVGDKAMSGTADMGAITQSSMSKYSKSLENGVQDAVDIAAGMGAGDSNIMGAAALKNKARLFKIDEDLGKKDIIANKNQAETKDKLTNSFADSTKTVVDFQAQMEALARKDGVMEMYTGMVAKATTELADLTTDAIEVTGKAIKMLADKMGIELPKKAEAPEKGLIGGLKDMFSKASDSMGEVAKWATTPIIGGPGPSKKFGADVETAIADASAETGVDAGYMRTMAKIESGGDPNAKNKSGAKGLYQFVPGTAQAYGISGQEFDPKQSALAAAKMTIANKKQLEKSGVEATPEMLYMAHQQGAGGTSKLVKAARQNKGWDDLDAKTQQNMAANAGKGMSPSEFISMWQKKYQKASEGGTGHPVEHQHVGVQDPIDLAKMMKPKDAYTDTANLVGNAIQKKLDAVDSIQTSADQMSAQQAKDKLLKINDREIKLAHADSVASKLDVKLAQNRFDSANLETAHIKKKQEFNKQDLANLQTAHNKKTEPNTSVTDADKAYSADQVKVSKARLDEAELQVAHTKKKQEFNKQDLATAQASIKPIESPSVAQANAGLIDASKQKLSNIEEQQKLLQEHAESIQANAPQKSLIGKNDVIPEEMHTMTHVVAAIKEMHQGVTKHLKHGNSQREVIKKQNA